MARKLALLALATLLPLAPPAGAQTERPGDPPATTEKDLLAEFNKAVKVPGGKERAAAYTALGEASRSLPDKGASKLLAKTLARGLDEDDLEIRSAVVAQLGWGRDVDTVIAGFKGFLDGQLKDVDKRITRPDEESRSYVGSGVVLLGNACTALANYRDDRSIEILASLLRNLRQNSEGADLSTRVVGPIAKALLSLGTHDAVEAAVKQTQTFTGDWQGPAAKNLHEALAQFATAAGAAPPDYSDNVAVAWHEWFQKNADKFPRKIGKLKEPPASPPPGMDGKEMRTARDGSAERP